MSSQDVFWINAGLGVLFVALFLYRRGPREPTRLKLRAGAKGDRGLVLGDAASAAKKPRRTFFGGKPGTGTQNSSSSHTMDPATEAAQGLHDREKSLNVLFNYNGHTWDAYEVLGVPAGASWPMVEAAYKKSAAQADPQSGEFLKTAFEAIRTRRPRG